MGCRSMMHLTLAAIVLLQRMIKSAKLFFCWTQSQKDRRCKQLEKIIPYFCHKSTCEFGLRVFGKRENLRHLFFLIFSFNSARYCFPQTHPFSSVGPLAFSCRHITFVERKLENTRGGKVELVKVMLFFCTSLCFNKWVEDPYWT